MSTNHATEDGGTHGWRPVQYNASRVPHSTNTFNLIHDPTYPENFVRSARWSPDGSSILCYGENKQFQILELPPEFLDTALLRSGHPEPAHRHRAYERSFRQPAAILDFLWYPTASPKDPTSYCFLASVRECPVKLLDATDGRLRASYRIVDHRERQIAPHSLAFSLNATKIYCGFEDAIEVFDIHTPGEGIRLPMSPTKKSKDGMKGIISAIAISNAYDSYAVGSLSIPCASWANMALMSESCGGQPVAYVGVEGTDVRSGVTQLHFNPLKPYILYAAFRRHDAIYSWDLRGDCSTPLAVYRDKDAANESARAALTNQRIRFDVDLAGKWLCTGRRNGEISIFDLDAGEGAEEKVNAAHSGPMAEVHPALTFRAHDDVVNSVAFHPLHPSLLSAAGSRHFSDDSSASDTSSGSEDKLNSEESDSGDISPIVRQRRAPHPRPSDSSTKTWCLE